MTMIEPIAVRRSEKERQIERLTLKVADLQSENTQLRRRLPKSTGDMRRLRQAYRDAQAMLVHRFSGYAISRQNCLALGIPERRWTVARALLRLATVHDGNDVAIEDFDQAMALLSGTFGSMEKAGTAERLKTRIPPSRLWQVR